MSKKRDHTFTAIVIGVMAAHLLLFAVMELRTSSKEPPLPVQQKITVQTIQLNEEPALIAFQEEEEAPPAMPDAMPEMIAEVIPQTPPPEPEPTPKPPKTTPKPQVKETPKPKPEKKVEAKKPEPHKPKGEAKKPEPKKVEKKKIAEKPKEVKKPTPKPETKTAKPVTPPKAPAPDPKVEAAKAEAKAKQQKLMKSAKESLANIDKTAHKLTASNNSVNSKTSPLARIEKLEIEALPAHGSKGASALLTAPEASYRSELIHRLKLLLRLPEFGEVKVQLTLERTGRVAKVVIVSAESSANRKYIEKALPAATFPSFGDNFGQEPQYTFLLSLSNDV